MRDKSIKIPVDQNFNQFKSKRAYELEDQKGDEYKKYREKWVQNPKNFILEDGPINLDIEITNCCNLKCPMCPRTVMINDNVPVNGGNFNTGFMEFSLYKSLIDQAVELGIKAVKLNWLGEPTMHKDLVKMVAYAKDKGILDVLINTNGVFVNKKIAKELIEAGLDKLLFSFDSPYKEDYEKIRIGADYEEVIENIKYVNKLRNDLNKINPITRVSMVMMRENQHQFKDFLDMFKDHVDIVAWSEYTNKEELLGDERKRIKRKKIKNFACAQLWQRMFVSWNGNIAVCCADVKMEYAIGNAFKEKLKDIWKNDRYQYLRNMHMEGKYDSIPICSKCDMPEFYEEAKK
ncbi:radical SAM/SPASM domain-containing protein [Pseudobacteroides cellulosolvens]|uniref:Radical SAM domain protein n=1 Tax=Pseudobacteroides cellulosolvens ATCC 35603 = DSM 2933 TaxID=398512 RepID=A0A0L6JSB3_9FIRM|nr:radical SAM protein [Pseudobacteroides cellulosolvens]KNY28614.1 Radical SAM domain protein [Pseudobacteroides cellulosolvens ATCC 35603 = DSM 2933]